MRKTYDRDFKIKVSKDIGNGLITVSEVAREYNISRPIVSRWVAEYNRYGNKAFSGNGKRLPSNEKIYILEEENKRFNLGENFDFRESCVNLKNYINDCKRIYKIRL